MTNVRTKLFKCVRVIKNEDIQILGTPIILTIENDSLRLKSFNKNVSVLDVYLTQYSKEEVEHKLNIYPIGINRFEQTLFNEWCNRELYVPEDDFMDIIIRPLELCLTNEIRDMLNIDTISELISLIVHNYAYIINRDKLNRVTMVNYKQSLITPETISYKGALVANPLEVNFDRTMTTHVPEEEKTEDGYIKELIEEKIYLKHCVSELQKRGFIIDYDTDSFYPDIFSNDKRIIKQYEDILVKENREKVIRENLNK